MTEREKLEAWEKKKRIYYRENGRCEVCGKLIPLEQSQLGHRIGQTKQNLKKYGKKIIHHEKNMALTCSLRCNAKVDISHNPVKVAKLLSEILEEEL